MGMLMWFKIAKKEKSRWAILEIAANTHSPFSPYLADFSACVPPALQNGSMNFFVFCNFESHKHPHNKFWSQNSLIIFILWATLAILAKKHALKKYDSSLWGSHSLNNNYTQVGKGSSEEKNDQRILTSKFVMGMFMWFKIAKNKKNHWAILEIEANTHSLFSPYLADFSACLPPAFLNGFMIFFCFLQFWIT